MASKQPIDSVWANPPSIYRSAPFWSWNGELQPDRLCDAIESMHEAGMGGFFMHSRYGLKTPYLSEEWFRCVSACVEKARELGMKAYLYDEDRWPSGPAGGLVTRDKPRNRMVALSAVRQADAIMGAKTIAKFAVTLDEGGRVKSCRRAEKAEDGEQLILFQVIVARTLGWINDGAAPDLMRRGPVAEFLRVTHDEYAKRFGKDFGGVIPAIFTDEPNYSHMWTEVENELARIPWTTRMPQEFARRRGYDLIEKLPEAVLQMADDQFVRARHDLFRTATELFVENFSAQVGRWCGKHDIALTGHMLGEESLPRQIIDVGAAMPHYKHMQWPGIDILSDQAEELATAKQCSSVADQFGRERVLSEMYGCTGWDWPLEGHKFIGDWQAATGVNFRCPHLTHYTLAGGAKRDYPASIFEHSPWWKYYRSVEDYFARINLMLTRGEAVRDVLVVHPVESAWGLHEKEENTPSRDSLSKALKTIIYTLSGEHYDWDFGDESLMEKHARAKGDVLKIGKMSYALVVVPPSLTLRASTAALLREFVAGGGKVLFIGQVPDCIDGVRSQDVAALSAEAKICGPSPEEFIPTIETLLARRVSVTENDAQQRCIWTMLRKVRSSDTGNLGSGQVLFLQSHDREHDRCVHVSVAGRGPVVLWDALSGGKRRVKSRKLADRVEFDLLLPPTASAMISLGLRVPDAGAPAKPVKILDTQSLEGPFPVELTEPNTLPLDYCTFRLNDEEFSQPVHSLKADTLIRERFGLDRRMGMGHQPWYLYKSGVVDTRPRAKCEIRRGFHVSSLPGRCALAIERPEDFEITVNGLAVGEVDGWWVDRDIKTIDITDLLRTGDNEVTLRMDYRADMELEDLYLVGEFGVARRGGAEHTWSDVTMTAALTELPLGSWVSKGLDFYGGSVKYRLGVTAPKPGRRLRLRLPEVACTAAAILVNGKTFALPWAPFAADITDALHEGENDVEIDIIGGRKNILGPLHAPWGQWTGPGQFDPDCHEWTDSYLLTDHGLLSAPILETVK